MEPIGKNPSGKFACVVCIEKNGDESQIVVPFNWIDEENKLVYWSSTIHARQEFDNCAPINTNWPTYPLVKKLVEGSHELCQQYWFEYSTSSGQDDSPVKNKNNPQQKTTAYKSYPDPPPKKGRSFSSCSKKPESPESPVKRKPDSLTKKSSNKSYPDPPPKKARSSPNSSCAKKTGTPESPVKRKPDSLTKRSQNKSYPDRPPNKGVYSPVGSFAKEPESPVKRKPDSLTKRSKSDRREDPPPNSAYNVPDSEDGEDENYWRASDTERTPPKETHFQITDSRDSNSNFLCSTRKSPRLALKNSPYARKSLGFNESSRDTGKRSNKDGPSSSKNKERYPLSTADYQRKTVKLLLDIKKYLKKNDGWNGNEKLYQRSSPARCDTLEQLIEFERSLSNQSEYEKLIDLLMTVGGNDARAILRRMLALLTTNKVLSSLNWDGTGNKTGFEATFPNLLEALQKCTIAKVKADDAVVKDRLQKILKDAPDREGGTRWAKKKENKK
ncbi:nucleolar and coiled-body phosphoprotein 1-like [Clytia hemisphaerica]|uniref:DUF4806 domain-containing protein n=1 Tax=Clytia hemisphaerica TaxID=252671 RepID=A0A7M5V7A2_9CNID